MYVVEATQRGLCFYTVPRNKQSVGGRGGGGGGGV